MTEIEQWLPLLIVVFTTFSIILLSLPSTFGADIRFKRDGSPIQTRIQVVVLGDIGRSPRIQYHAISIAEHGGLVDLIGYTGSEPHPKVTSNPRITVYGLSSAPDVLKTNNKWLFSLFAPLKVVFQTLSLYYALGYRTPPAKWLLVQNPPTIPTLMVAELICFVRNTRLVIDWHNFGYSILGLKLGPNHPVVQLSRRLEKGFSSRASAHLAVSNAMARVLKDDWGIKSPVLPLHDRPFSQFQPLEKSQRTEFITQCTATASFKDELQSGSMRLLVSSTSWTPDEDFSLLLDALVSYSELTTGTNSHLPKILAIITGKGPQKETFLLRIRALTNAGKLSCVHLRTAWLSVEDYAKLLASADLGVSLHTSSSGLDLPMKVVDMLGCGLPVVGWDRFEAWPELNWPASLAVRADDCKISDEEQYLRAKDDGMTNGTLWQASFLGSVHDIHFPIPRRDYGKNPHHPSNMDPWIHISFKVNTFTFDEWPPQAHSKLENLSIGEEQSPSLIVALSWSPLGLARHKRSALAILTTNYQVSLWASDSDLTAASTWRRVLVVNKSLQTPPADQSPIEDHERRSARIRSMSWAPRKTGLGSQRSLLSISGEANAAHSVQYLAVTNDAGGVVILDIRSPWLHHRHMWEAQVTHHVDWGDLVRFAESTQSDDTVHSGNSSTIASGEEQWPSLFASCLAKKDSIDQPATGYHLLIAQEHPPAMPEYRLPILAPLFSLESLSHIAVTNNQSEIELLSYQTPENLEDSTQILSKPQTAPKTLTLVDEWDSISGLAFLSIAGEVVLHASGFLSGSFSYHVMSENGANTEDSELNETHRSALHDQATMLQKDFDRHHDLGGLSHVKTWGVASWGPYVASCITMHPNHMIEYSMTSEHRCHVLFNHEITSSGFEEDIIFPWQDTSTTMPQETSSAVIDKILIILSEMAILRSTPGTQILYNICCAAMVSLDTYEWHGVEKILQGLSILNGISFEPEINVLNNMKTSRVAMPERMSQINAITNARTEAQGPAALHDLYEFCSICDQLIPWQSLNEAYCISGHQFARCGLTFLPITEPGISKHCETCDREFLDKPNLLQQTSDDGIGPDEQAAVDVQNGDEAHGITDMSAGVLSSGLHAPANNLGSRRLSSSLSLLEAISDQFDSPSLCLTDSEAIQYVSDLQRKLGFQSLAQQQKSTRYSQLPSMTSRSITAHDKRISLSSTKSALPVIVSGPTSPAVSLKANLSFGNLMAFSNVPTDRKASIAVSTGSSNDPNRTLDCFEIPSSAEDVDPDEQIAAHTLADFVSYPNDSHTAGKSPPPRHHFRSGSVSLPAPSGAASFVTTSSAQPDASTRAIKSPRGSVSTGGSFATPNAVGFPGSRKQRVASGSSRSIPDGFPASEAVPSQAADDSPTLGPTIDGFPLPPTTKPRKGKARDSLLLNRYSNTSDGSTKAQKERKPSVDTQDTTEKAEKGLHLPFLPKFLKLAGSPRQSMSAGEPEHSRNSMEITEVDEIPPKEQNQAPVKSIFEEESSDEDANQTYDEHAFIGGAKLAASRRATMIETAKASGKRVVSMQDILKEGGIEAVAEHLQRDGTSILADSNPGPSRLKAKRLLGESSIKMKRAGIVGMPAVHETSGSVQASLDDAEPVKGNPSWLDGLRSNPVKRAATAPARKRVTLSLEIGDEHKVRKDSIVSTPYPIGYKGRRSEDMEDKADSTNNAASEKRLGEGEAMIILVLHSHSSTTPTIKKLVVPGRKETDVVDEDEEKPQFRAKIVEDFDDEKLFRLIQKRYIDMRGIISWFTSARGVKGINLLGYHKLSQLAAKEDRLTRRKTFRVYDDVFTEQRMLDLWKAPRSGRKKHEWVEWIRRLPRFSEGLHSNEENVALELVEGWNVRKIGFALSLVVMLSLLGTLLWTFLAVNGGVRLQNDAMVGYPVELRMMSAGFRQAGTRVQTGLALGILVLLLGWTGVGAWILLSWLVM
ncbi:MAG: hypothetical protein Q9213_006881 [Squamulea squamosa]